MDTFPPAKQRARLIKLMAAIDVTGRALRRDECGDPRLEGSRGHIYAAPEGFQFVLCGGSVRRWTYTKQVLSFARLVQDGDDEGVFLLDRLPTAAEGHVIRDRFGIRRRVRLGDEELERRRVQGRALAARRFPNEKQPLVARKSTRRPAEIERAGDQVIADLERLAGVPHEEPSLEPA